MLGTIDIIRFLDALADDISAERERLTALDSAIGDGDHGINMDRGFAAVRQILPELAGGDLGTLCNKVGMTLMSAAGGASGPLYGTFFLRMGSTFGPVRTFGSTELATALRAGLDGVVELGKARSGDKTMVDALVPAIDALEAGVESGHDLGRSLGAAAAAAASGRDGTIPLVARKGRASYLGDRSVGHQDPGATSSAILFTALRDALTTVRLTVRNPSGLHARSAAQFVRTAGRFRSTITITDPARGGGPVDAKSILSVMTLGISRGTEIEIAAEGDDAGSAIAAITEAVESGLGESLEPYA